jgi:TolB-like protein
MRLLNEIKERRLIPLMAAYLVTGFVALEAIDQLISYRFVPEMAYPVTLVLYLFGIPGSLVFAWFHGAPGKQSAPRVEVVLQASLAIVAIATGVYVYRAQAASLAAAAEGGLPPTSVAVLYFEDVSPGGDLGYVADGITEALIEQLDEVPSLDVVSRNGVIPFRDGDLRSDSIARILRVGTLVEGAVDQRGDELRISTRLVDGFSGADIERAAVAIPAGEFLAARDSVAASVALLLRQRLGEDVRVRELRSGTSSDEAWAFAQRAERLATDAEEEFERAEDPALSVARYVEADSLLALAEVLDPEWTYLAGARARAAYRRAWFTATIGDLETAMSEIDVGIDHANRGLALDPRDGYALEQRGTLRLLGVQMASALGESDTEVLDGLAEGARADLEAAVAADPSLATAHAMLSFFLAGGDDYVGAIISGQRALEEDAYLRGAERIYDRLVFAQYQVGQFNDARRWCDEGRARFPDDYRFVECQLWMLTTPGEEPDVQAAWDLRGQLVPMVPEPIRSLRRGVADVMVAGVLMRAELPDSADGVLARIDRSEDVDPQSLTLQYEAGMRASTGDLEGGLEALRRYVASTPGGTFPQAEARHWWWRDLQSDPGFRSLLDPSG